MVRNKSFTLIELLVVIAIIGLLASIVLVSTKGLREKARIAKTLEFSQSVQNALGSEAVGIWSFDENSGTVAKDSSGYGSNGTLYSGAAVCANPPTAGCPTWTDDTPQKIIGQGAGKYALSFDGVDDRIPMSNTETSVLYGWTQGTIEFWFNPSEFIATRELWSKTGSTDSGLYVNSTGGQIQFRLGFVAGGVNLNSVSNLSLNNWYHIVTSFDSSGMKIYINGVLDSSDTNTGVTESIATHQFTLGSSGTQARFVKGIYDEVRVYSKALILGEIQQHYAEGLEKHKLVLE